MSKASEIETTPIDNIEEAPHVVAADPAPEAVVDPYAGMSPRDRARAMVFNTKPNEEPITVFGVPCILRDPSIGDVLSARSAEDNKAGMAMLIIRYTCLAETGEPLFDDEDADGILALPYGADMQELNKKITTMMGVQPTQAMKTEAPE